MQQQKLNSQRSATITFYTLALFIIGLCSFANPIVCVIAVIVLLISIKLKIDRPAQNQKYFLQQANELVKIAITIIIFGIIDFLSIINLKNYYFDNASQNNQIIVPDAVNQFGGLNAQNGDLYTSNYANKVEFPLFSTYVLFMTVYYYFQFQLVNNFHHKQLNWNSFLIYHSKQYTIANICSLSQHFIAKYLFGFGYKDYHLFIYPALIGMIFGEGLRIAAFFTAKNNFTHLIRHSKTAGHQLITNGVYSVFRHPSYTGYFYFAVCGQLFLGNFISSIVFFFALTRFFNQRIEYEQQTLIDFFDVYAAYKKTTMIMIPFVKDPQFKQQ